MDNQWDARMDQRQDKIHQIIEHLEERAVLVSLVTTRTGDITFEIEDSLSELKHLAETAGLKVLDAIVQQRVSPDPAWFIGKGKVDEVRALLEANDANVVVFDQELSGAQVRNLEQKLDAKIIDRTQLILDIFAQRARTREGKLQVELAQLSYLLPRLSGHGVHLSRLGGGIGTRGPGETKLETDRRHIRNRIADLKEQLKVVVRHRSLHRERRKKTGVIQVALVGYTNAGKSTMLKQLTGAEAFIENQLFATLDPTARGLILPNGKEVIITDTVGFIRNLPHDLVAAFRATLEEVSEADCILHIVDSSSPMRDEQMRVVDRVLEQLDAHQKDRLVVFNKIDLIDPLDAEMLTANEPFVAVSAYREEDVIRLKQAIQDKLSGDVLTYRIPVDRGELIALAHRLGDVLHQQMDETHVIYKVRVDKIEFEQQGYMLEPFIEKSI